MEWARVPSGTRKIDSAEHHRSQPADHSGSDHPKGDLRPFAVVREQVHDVEGV
jgi:hypothetical protein